MTTKARAWLLLALMPKEFLFYGRTGEDFGRLGIPDLHLMLTCNSLDTDKDVARSPPAIQEWVCKVNGYAEVVVAD